MHDPSKVQFKKILIIRLGAMGDVLLTSLLLRNLKRRFPNADIDFLVKETYTSLVSSNPNVKNVIPLKVQAGFSDLLQAGREIRNHQYDAVINLQNNFRSCFIARFSKAPNRKRYRLGRWTRFLLVKLNMNLLRNVKPVPLRMLDTIREWSVQDDGLGLDLFISDKIKKHIETRLQKMGVDKKESLIAMAPGASRETKRWLQRRFVETGRYFQKKKYRIILVGGKEDQNICSFIRQKLDHRPVNLAGECSLEETAAALQQADLLITNDSGIMHMAAALGKPVAAIFGPTSEHLGFFPFRTKFMVVEKFLKCRPCSYHGTKKCPKKHFRCMKEITTLQVVKAAEALLQGEPL